MVASGALCERDFEVNKDFTFTLCDTKFPIPC